MTPNPNQPNRGSQGNPGGASRAGSQGTSQQDPQAQSHKSSSSPSRDEGTRFGSSALQQAFSGGEDLTRCLDAIEENVSKLRSAIGGSGRTGVAERESRSGRSDRASSGSDEERSETSGNL